MLVRTLPGRMGLVSPRFLTAMFLLGVLGVAAGQLQVLLGELQHQVLYLEKQCVALNKYKTESKRNWTRMKAGEKLVRELAAGDVSLSVGARQFCELYANGPSMIWKLVSEESGETDAERLCQYLVSLAERSVVRSSRQSLRTRLEAEMGDSISELAHLRIPEPRQEPRPVAWEPGERDLLERAWFLLNFDGR